MKLKTGHSQGGHDTECVGGGEILAFLSGNLLHISCVIMSQLTT